MTANTIAPPTAPADTANSANAAQINAAKAPDKPAETKPPDTGYEGEYTIDEISFTLEPKGWTIELIGYKPDPNAPPPGIFKHDPANAGDRASVAGAGSLPSNPSEINGKLLAAAKSNKGQSSADGPGGGNVACAWCMNKFVFVPGIGHTIGNDAVENVVADLEKGYGVKIPNDQALAGDVVIMGDNAHVGICLTDKGTEILSNSSSNRAFVWVDDYAGYDGFYKAGKCKTYRVIK